MSRISIPDISFTLKHSQGAIRYVKNIPEQKHGQKKRLANDEPQSMQIRKLLSAKNERCDSWMFQYLPDLLGVSYENTIHHNQN